MEHFPNDVICAPLLSSFMSRLETYLFCSVHKKNSSLRSLCICAWLGRVIDFLASHNKYINVSNKLKFIAPFSLSSYFSELYVVLVCCDLDL